MLQFDEFLLDLDGRTLWRGKTPVPLTSKAFDLLALLVAERPKVVSKNRLHDALWPGTYVTEASLHGLISELRAALGDTPRQPRFLRTVHRYGYAFQADVTDDRAAASALRTPPGVPVDSPVTFTLVWGDRELPLAPGENVIGRDADARVSIPATTVSRRHARITIAGRQALLEDLDSKNGTTVAGEPVDAPRPLRHGDEIRFGSVQVTFRAVDVFTATAPIAAGS